MGEMIDGVWRDIPRDTKSTGGAFVRPETQFRDKIGAAEPGRYHLWVSRACPWAHRTLIVRALKGLGRAIPVHYADPYMAANGWEFPGEKFRYLHELYAAARPGYSGRVTVPVLWDSRERRIVNNESAEIIRMFNEVSARGPDLYPASLRKEIDQVNERVYRTLNNGVYRAGFATAQGKYDEAVTQLFATLDWLEERLARRQWLVDGQLTEADIRLFTTAIRFDAVYYSHFKCNLRQLRDYPNLWRHTRTVHALPGVAKTVDLAEIKAHYYRSQAQINPTRIVPRGPAIDLRLPRARSQRRSPRRR
jgi:putative glutathione S-transferase